MIVDLFYGLMFIVIFLGLIFSFNRVDESIEKLWEANITNMKAIGDLVKLVARKEDKWYD